MHTHTAVATATAAAVDLRAMQVQCTRNVQVEDASCVHLQSDRLRHAINTDQQARVEPASVFLD